MGAEVHREDAKRMAPSGRHRAELERPKEKEPKRDESAIVGTRQRRNIVHV